LEDVATRHDADGWEIWVGRSARANDTLSLKLARPRDLWFHVAGSPGSHVIVRRDSGEGDPPRSVLERAAALAAWHSKARDARGKVPVHWCEAGDVGKARGAPAGQVRLRRYEVMRVYARAGAPKPDE
jgi:predicted ribosome quality control (RQC) complex YloA/Tae2 family protein